MYRCFHGVRTGTCLLVCVTSTIITIAVIVVFTTNVTKWERLPTPPSSATRCTLNTQLLMDVNNEVNVNSPTQNDRLVETKTNKTLEIKIHKYLNIFNASDENDEERNSINANRCVTLRTTVGNTPICVYDPKIDKFVSRSIVNGGMWDRVGVQVMTSFLTENSDMQLLDIGSNVGVFTLQAAKMGRKVIAVDANKFNLRLLAKSLRLSDLQKYVTLVWNAITDIHETVNLTITTGNIGGSFVKSEGEPVPPAKDKFNKQTTLAITLEDLDVFLKGNPVFMKIDIERSEWKAFRGGEIFFQEVEVRYVLMEWWTYKKESHGREVIRFMSRCGYEPYPVRRPLKIKLNVKQFDKWPADVLWVKK